MEIDVEAIQIFLNEKPMIRLLGVVEQAGVKGIATRRLLKRLGANGLHPLLTRAERLGYLKRTRSEPEGKGNHLIVNSITPKGKRLLLIITALPEPYQAFKLVRSMCCGIHPLYGIMCQIPV